MIIMKSFASCIPLCQQSFESPTMFKNRTTSRKQVTNRF